MKNKLKTAFVFCIHTGLCKYTGQELLWCTMFKMKSSRVALNFSSKTRLEYHGLTMENGNRIYKDLSATFVSTSVLPHARLLSYITVHNVCFRISRKLYLTYNQRKVLHQLVWVFLHRSQSGDLHSPSSLLHNSLDWWNDWQIGSCCLYELHLRHNLKIQFNMICQIPDKTISKYNVV